MIAEDYEDGHDNRLEVTLAMVIGAVLVAVGVLAPLLGGPEGEFLLFGRNYLHDAIHVLTGGVALAGGYFAGGRYANTFAIGLGVGYLLVGIAGLVLFELLTELLALNMADNALHLFLAISLLGVGVVFRIAE